MPPSPVTSRKNYPLGWWNKRNERKYLLHLYTVFIVFSWPLLAGAGAFEHQDFTLKNGLRVILVKEAKAPIIISQVWYRVGAVDEKIGKTGLAHMLEHMMFQGTKKVPLGEFNQIVSRNGGQSNASTSHDYTNYYIKLASDRIELALRLEADRMRHLQLRAKAFLSENQVVQEERRTRTDAKPNRRFLEKFRAKAYTGKAGNVHPYGRPVIGWMTDIQTLTLDDLQSWYQRYYAPNNAILVLVGDLELASAAQKVRNHFGDLPALPDRLHETGEHEAGEPKMGERTKLPAYVARDHDTPWRMEVTDKNVTLPQWYASYPVPTLATEGKEDVFALDVLATILGGDSSSRLYKKLVIEEGLAISADASYGGYSRGWELFTLSSVPKLDAQKQHSKQANMDPDTGKNSPESDATLALMEQSILHEVARLAKEPVSQRTLQRAKNSMIARHVFAQDSIYMVALYIGLLSVNEVDWLPIIKEYPQKIEAVRAADVQRVAARYLTPEQMIIGVLKP